MFTNIQKEAGICDVTSEPGDETKKKFLTVIPLTFDHYMADPNPAMDYVSQPYDCNKIKQVPILRVFGSTPGGQSACLHVHKVLPYFYVRCENAAGITVAQAESFAKALANGLDRALTLHLGKSPCADGKLECDNPNKDIRWQQVQQHVHAVTLVAARSIYGYHSDEEAFAKIQLYDPRNVKRASELLQVGAVLQRCFQPFEAHIPYYLQFQVDYNISGMGQLQLGNALFRGKLPFQRRKGRWRGWNRPRCTLNVSENDGILPTGGLKQKPTPQIWLERNTPNDWKWIDGPDKHSTCEIEADVMAEDILNRDEFDSLRIELKDVNEDTRMVRSLAPMWNEELARIATTSNSSQDHFPQIDSFEDAWAALRPPSSPPRNPQPLPDCAKVREQLQSIYDHTTFTSSIVDPVNNLVSSSCDVSKEHRCQTDLSQTCFAQSQKVKSLDPDFDAINLTQANQAITTPTQSSAGGLLHHQPYQHAPDGQLGDDQPQLVDENLACSISQNDNRRANSQKAGHGQNIAHELLEAAASLTQDNKCIDADQVYPEIPKELPPESCHQEQANIIRNKCALFNINSANLLSLTNHGENAESRDDLIDDLLSAAKNYKSQTPQEIFSYEAIHDTYRPKQEPLPSALTSAGNVSTCPATCQEEALEAACRAANGILLASQKEISDILDSELASGLELTDDDHRDSVQCTNINKHTDAYMIPQMDGAADEEDTVLAQFRNKRTRELGAPASLQNKEILTYSKDKKLPTSSFKSCANPAKLSSCETVQLHKYNAESGALLDTGVAASKEIRSLKIASIPNYHTVRSFGGDTTAGECLISQDAKISNSLSNPGSGPAESMLSVGDDKEDRDKLQETYEANLTPVSVPETEVLLEASQDACSSQNGEDVDKTVTEIPESSPAESDFPAIGGAVFPAVWCVDGVHPFQQSATSAAQIADEKPGRQHISCCSNIRADGCQTELPPHSSSGGCREVLSDFRDRPVKKIALSRRNCEDIGSRHHKHAPEFPEIAAGQPEERHAVEHLDLECDSPVADPLAADLQQERIAIQGNRKDLQTSDKLFNGDATENMHGVASFHTGMSPICIQPPSASQFKLACLPSPVVTAAASKPFLTPGCTPAVPETPFSQVLQSIAGDVNPSCHTKRAAGEDEQESHEPCDARALESCDAKTAWDDPKSVLRTDFPTSTPHVNWSIAPLLSNSSIAASVTGSNALSSLKHRSRGSGVPSLPCQLSLSQAFHSQKGFAANFMDHSQNAVPGNDTLGRQSAMIRPKELPPDAKSLFASCHNYGIDSIIHKVPFFGNLEHADEIKSRSHVVAGRTFSILSYVDLPPFSYSADAHFSNPSLQAIGFVSNLKENACFVPAQRPPTQMDMDEWLEHHRFIRLSHGNKGGEASSAYVSHPAERDILNNHSHTANTSIGTGLGSGSSGESDDEGPPSPKYDEAFFFVPKSARKFHRQRSVQCSKQSCLNDRLPHAISSLSSESKKNAHPTGIRSASLLQNEIACSQALNTARKYESTVGLNMVNSDKKATGISTEGEVSQSIRGMSCCSFETCNAQERRSVSQITPPGSRRPRTPLSQAGFKIAGDKVSASMPTQHSLLVCAVEVLAATSSCKLPDPRKDAVLGIIMAAMQDESSAEPVVRALVIDEDAAGPQDIESNTSANWFGSTRKTAGWADEGRVDTYPTEEALLSGFAHLMQGLDPDVIVSWDIMKGGLGYLAERAASVGVIAVLQKISRTPDFLNPKESFGRIEQSPPRKPACRENQDGNELLTSGKSQQHVPGFPTGGDDLASGSMSRQCLQIVGRVAINLWEIMRNEVKLHIYTFENCVHAILQLRFPKVLPHKLAEWNDGRRKWHALKHMSNRVVLTLKMMQQMDLLCRISELSQTYGIDFTSVMTRGSQYRVEALMSRLAHTQNFLLISPSKEQVARQPGMACLPLVMEPESCMYTDPVVVLDFQSLYPSMMIAYNLCYSTMIGSAKHFHHSHASDAANHDEGPPGEMRVKCNSESQMGVIQMKHMPSLLSERPGLDPQSLVVVPNGFAFAPPSVRSGVLPRMLQELLATRVMVKSAMKRHPKSHKVLQRILNARQFALKMISNVTYGYTSAGFSGRMPCAELADAIVSAGRATLERAIHMVNEHPDWGAKVVYGDTDSMFVLLKGRSREDAFRIGAEIAATVTACNPSPVSLKMEKVYHPCILQTKKRYVGFMYETPGQVSPSFDAKGIETVRRDACPAVQKILEASIRILFTTSDVSQLRQYLEKTWRKILTNRISIQDFIFAKEVRLHHYRTPALVPGAVVAAKAMALDPRAEPAVGERVRYCVIYGAPGARLVDMVVAPEELINSNGEKRLHVQYYIKKQIIPALDRVLSLIGIDCRQWFISMNKVNCSVPQQKRTLSRLALMASGDHNANRSTAAPPGTIDGYFMSRHCVVCDGETSAKKPVCHTCSQNSQATAAVLEARAASLEGAAAKVLSFCLACGGGTSGFAEGVCCVSLDCSLFFERRKLDQESTTARKLADAGLAFCI